MLLWTRTGDGGEEQEQERGERRGRKNPFIILYAIRHVPHAWSEEVTLRPHVPHPLPLGDRCAEHGPQEYGPAAGKGHTEEPLVPHTEYTCRH